MAFNITFTPSGHQVTVASEQSILAAAIENGLGLPYSCKTGICRTCRGKIKSGEVDLGDAHPDYLSETERAQGYALLCQAKALSNCTIEIAERDLGGIRPKVIPCRVVSFERPSHDVAVLRLKLPMNEKMRFLPGQYIEFLLKDGKRRSYSIANSPDVQGLNEIELHIRHLPGGLFTDHVFTQMKARDMMRFEGPFGSSCLREDSGKPIVMVASGTGFAPVKSMVEYALKKKICNERPITLYWGCRTRADFYMIDVPIRWAAENSNVSFVPVLSDPTPECAWSGRTGLVHHAAMADFPNLSDSEVYACGAPIMVDSAKQDFIQKCMLPADAFFADSFISEADRTHAGAPGETAIEHLSTAGHPPT
ncbi:CDP-6-deoxy-delta-3,4-glucoseen reductase [Eoetvoesiella caeni]